jgi:hypothetical protein
MSLCGALRLGHHPAHTPGSQSHRQTYRQALGEALVRRAERNSVGYRKSRQLGGGCSKRTRVTRFDPGRALTNSPRAAEGVGPEFVRPSFGTHCSNRQSPCDIPRIRPPKLGTERVNDTPERSVIHEMCINYSVVRGDEPNLWRLSVLIGQRQCLDWGRSEHQADPHVRQAIGPSLQCKTRQWKWCRPSRPGCDGGPSNGPSFRILIRCLSIRGACG